MTAKTVEAKVWPEACSLLCLVPDPALSTSKGDAAGRWQDSVCCTYLGMQAPAEQLDHWETSPRARPCLSVTLIGNAQGSYVTITSPGGDWCCVLQLVSRLRRSYCQR